MPSKGSFETFRQRLCSVVCSWTPRLGRQQGLFPRGALSSTASALSLTCVKILLNICGMKECSGLGPKSRRNSCSESRGQLGVSLKMKCGLHPPWEGGWKEYSSCLPAEGVTGSQLTHRSLKQLTLFL